MGTVMYIAAHPDDENTRLITYLVHHDHMNTIYLSLTRGDGGQNIIGNEQGAALGLIRTNEMMMARKIDGGKQLFTRFIDFGYTKSPEETFRFWNKQQVVDDIRTAVQQYRPDVLICRFPTTGEGGHGQHTASAIAALEAFDQIRSSTDKNTWKPKRILFNAFKFGSASTIKEGQFELPTNQFDPILGEAYGEVAGRSRSEHKSQGAGTPQSYGISNENFELMAGEPMTTSLYDGIDTAWSRIGEKEIGKEIAVVINDFNFSAPQNSIRPLIKIKNKIVAGIRSRSAIKDGIPSFGSDLLMNKLTEINAIIASCAGVQIELLASAPTAIVGEKLAIEMKAVARAQNVQIKELIAAQGSQPIGEKIMLTSDKLWSTRFEYRIPSSNEITQPYWLTQSGTDNQFHYPFPYSNEALSKNDLIMVAILEIDSSKFSVEVPLSYKKLDPTRGDVIEAVRVMPDVDLGSVPSNIIIQKGASFQVGASIFSRIDIKNATLEILNKEGKIIASKKGLDINKNERKMVHTLVSAHSVDGRQGPEKIFYRLVANGKYHDKQLHLIQYPHIPTLQYFTKAGANVITQNWETRVRNIGYITGAGDKVAESLSELGLKVTMLNEADINATQLAQYEAIVCGVRFANTRKDLEKRLPELWKYIEQGGTVVMQYNTSMGLELKDFSPLRIDISRSRVTDEHAEVTFTDHTAKVLNSPNKIDDKDFENWVQERGVYYPDNWDKAFRTVMSMSDEGEAALNSAVLYATYGKGHFVYTPLAFFRQLPAGNPGAIKLFLNLLSIGK